MGDGVSTVVVPFGSWSITVDTCRLALAPCWPTRPAKNVPGRLGAVLAPSFRIGCSGRHADLAATLTLRPETLTAVATRPPKRLPGRGPPPARWFSTHGGNRVALGAAVAELNGTLPEGCHLRPVRRRRPEPGNLFRIVADAGDARPQPRTRRSRPGKPRPDSRARNCQRPTQPGAHQAFRRTASSPACVRHQTLTSPPAATQQPAGSRSVTRSVRS